MNIKELSKYDYVLEFKAMKGQNVMTDQDKKHIRIVATLQLAKEHKIEFILNHQFTESFLFDKETKIAYYCLRIRKERKVVKYADS